jgi:hypothetical protein
LKLKFLEIKKEDMKESKVLIWINNKKNQKDSSFLIKRKLLVFILKLKEREGKK